MAIRKRMYEKCYRNYKEHEKAMTLFIKSANDLFPSVKDTFEQFKEPRMKELNIEQPISS